MTALTAHSIPPATRRPAVDGGPPDADALALSHLPVVGHVVSEIMCRLPSHVARDDLAGAGVVALLLAARAYRPDVGVPFGQYARIRIRGAVVDELRRTDWASRGTRRENRRLTETEDRLRAELGRPAVDEELAAALGLTMSEVTRVRADRRRADVVPLDAPDAHDRVVADALASPDRDPEAHVAHAERIGALLSAVAALPPRLRTVVQGYDLDERSMSSIAADLGVTESRVSQMRGEAMAMLRDALAETPPQQVGVGPVAQRRRDAYVAAARGSSDLRTRVEVGATALSSWRTRPIG